MNSSCAAFRVTPQFVDRRYRAAHGLLVALVGRQRQEVVQCAKLRGDLFGGVLLRCGRVPPAPDRERQPARSKLPAPARRCGCERRRRAPKLSAATSLDWSGSGQHTDEAFDHLRHALAARRYQARVVVIGVAGIRQQYRDGYPKLARRIGITFCFRVTQRERAVCGSGIDTVRPGARGLPLTRASAAAIPASICPAA